MGYFFVRPVCVMYRQCSSPVNMTTTQYLQEQDKYDTSYTGDQRPFASRSPKNYLYRIKTMTCEIKSRVFRVTSRVFVHCIYIVLYIRLKCVCASVDSACHHHSSDSIPNFTTRNLRSQLLGGPSKVKPTYIFVCKI